jgi:hypothetical protein
MTRGIVSRFFLLSCLVATVACSGSAKPPKNAEDAENADNTESTSEDTTAEGEGKKPKVKEDSWDDVEQKDVKEEQKGARKKDEPKHSSNSVKDNPDPEFKEGGSVEEAIKAVPQGLPRENVELEELNKPLSDVTIYEPCKLNPSAHFEIKFAIWGGQAVGMDIKTMPKNPKLEACLREIVLRTKWRDKTKSLNISTVSF